MRNSATETGKEKKRNKKREERNSHQLKNLTVTVDNAEQRVRKIETDSFYTFPETEIEER